MKVIDAQTSKPEPTRLVGGVIVTHGHLASEFIAAAEMIAGPIPHVTPASIDTLNWNVRSREFHKAVACCFSPICLVGLRRTSPQCSWVIAESKS
jgi:hypothetical protein